MSHKALITGASRNIGLAVAQAFADLGHTVVINARDEAALEQATASIVDSGGDAFASPGDISYEEGAHVVVERAQELAGGPIDIFVHSATARANQRIVEMSVETWHTPLRVGLDGAFLVSRALLAGMEASGWGRLIFMTGLRGHTGNPGLAAVTAAKSGMTGLMKALAHEYAGTGVTVNAVSPGRVKTDRVDSELGDPEATAKHDAQRSKGIPVGRMGHPDEVAAACAYLISDAAGFVTGQTLHVNGGMLMP